MSVDFSAMSLDELSNARVQIEKEFAAKQAEGKREGIKQIQEIMLKFNLTVDDLSRGVGKRQGHGQGQTVAPKYRDPATGATWTGRGKAPKWIADKDRAQFAI